MQYQVQSCPVWVRQVWTCAAALPYELARAISPRARGSEIIKLDPILPIYKIRSSLVQSCPVSPKGQKKTKTCHHTLWVFSNSNSSFQNLNNIDLTMDCQVWTQKETRFHRDIPTFNPRRVKSRKEYLPNFLECALLGQIFVFWVRDFKFLLLACLFFYFL